MIDEKIEELEEDNDNLRKIIKQLLDKSIPSDIEIHDACLDLIKRLKNKANKENIIDISSWMMGANFVKKYIKNLK